jgi:hypothetical protein
MFDLKEIKTSISLDELKSFATNQYGDFTKAVVDIVTNKLVIGVEMHVDAEAYLLENGSKQENLWGINIYPELEKEDQIEFDSMINIRPTQGNRSREVEDLGIQKKIIDIVRAKIVE